MKFDNFNHLAVLRYVLWLHLLSGLLCIALVPSSGAILHQVCVNDATSSSNVTIMCGALDWIEVVSIYYDHHQAFSGTCEAPIGNNNCSKIFKTGTELGSKGPYHCSQSQTCDATVGDLPDKDCHNVTPNFVLMEYNCVPATDFIDLCGDDVSITSAIKHLAYFRGLKGNCTCLIRGSHTLTSVHVGIPATKSCSSEQLVIKWARMDNSENYRTITSKEPMINKDFKELQWSHITLVKTCGSRTPPVWFKIKPDNGATVMIQCGKSIETSSSTMSPSIITPIVTTGSTLPISSSTTEPTDTMSTVTPSPTLQTSSENGTLPLINKDKKVPVIVGSVVGGLVLIVIIIVLVFFVLRYKRRQKPPSELFGSDAAVDEAGSYGEMYDGKQQTYRNNAFEGGSTDYSLVKESEAVGGHGGKSRSAELSIEYDTLQPTSVLRSFPMQYKKTTEEQDGSVPIYDHTKHQTQTVRDSPGNDVKHSDYDVLESRANFNSSFNEVEISQDDTYSHIADDKKEPKNTNDANSYQEYANVSKNRAEEEIPTGDGINGRESTRNTKGDNLYHILEIPNSQELPTVTDNESLG